MGTRSKSHHKPALRLTFRISRYPDKTPGQKIRKYRLERDLKQVDLAKLLNIDEMTVVNWESNRTKPRRMLADRVNKRLGVEIFSVEAPDLLKRGIKK